MQSASAPMRFNMLGVHWIGRGSVEYRTHRLHGAWRAWRGVDDDARPDAASRERDRAWRDGNLDWAGGSDGVQFRTRGDVRRLRAYYLWSRVTAPARARRLATAGAPAIVTRALWQADEKIRRAKPRYAKSIKIAVVHHTAGTNAYTPAQAAAIVRGIEIYHVKGNGWDDIGYNFLVDRFGTVYEGRSGGVERNVIGAHAQGFNTGTVGVSLIGNFASATPPQAQQDALVNLLAWRLDVAHVDPLSTAALTSSGNPKFRSGRVVTLRAVSGHRDTGPSECPGNRAYALLPGLAKRIARDRRTEAVLAGRERRARWERALPGPAVDAAPVDGDGGLRDGQGRRDRPRHRADRRLDVELRARGEGAVRVDDRRGAGGQAGDRELREAHAAGASAGAGTADVVRARCSRRRPSARRPTASARRA